MMIDATKTMIRANNFRKMAPVKVVGAGSKIIMKYVYHESRHDSILLWSSQLHSVWTRYDKEVPPCFWRGKKFWDLS